MASSLACSQGALASEIHQLAEQGIPWRLEGWGE